MEDLLNGVIGLIVLKVVEGVWIYVIDYVLICYLNMEERIVKVVCLWF